MHWKNWHQIKKNNLHTILFIRQDTSKGISLPRSTVISKEKRESQKKVNWKEQENHVKSTEKVHLLTRILMKLSMDMQKVLMLPHLPGIKTALFTRWIIKINQSIAPLGSVKSRNGAQNNNKQTRGYLCNEVIRDRRDEDVTSVVIVSRV